MTGPPPYDLTVIIPTYNEEENILEMIRAVDRVCCENGIRCEILVVDDQSKDLTIPIVHDLMKHMGNLRILIRDRDHGLSQSLHEGFFAASSDLIQCIDSDFSHPPEMIPQFYRALCRDNCDVVIGSRYISGGGTINWPPIRKVLSFGAAQIGRMLIPIVKDSGSGFFAINRRVLAGAVLAPRGFRMCFEILGKGKWNTIREIPFVFKNRSAGKSKLKASIPFEYLVQCGSILRENFFAKRSGNILKAWKIFFNRSC